MGVGGTGWSALTSDMKMFGPALIMQDFLKNNTEMAGIYQWGIDRMRDF